MIRILGVDPGGTTGLSVLEHLHLFDQPPWHIEPSEVLGPTVVPLITSMLRLQPPTIVACERFVVSRRAGRSRTAGAGETARNIIGAVLAACEEQDIPVARYTASQVKAWATDRRLEVAGLIKPTRGLGHARDATRHALYTAVHRCGLPDPLSTKERT